MLGVASIQEALDLRKLGAESPFLLAQGIFQPEELELCAQNNFVAGFHSPEHIEWLEQRPLSKPIQAWLKVNTGMCRLGFNPVEAEAALKRLEQSPSIASVTLFTHFANANDKSHPTNNQQALAFAAFVNGKKNELSVCNSAGLFNFPELHFDYVRPGLAVYGISAVCDKSASDLDLRPVMTFKSALMAIQNLPKGARVGYDSRYECPEDMLVGIASCGYGDGYPLTAQDGAPVLVNGVQCRLAGKVSMDMMAIDLRNLKDPKLGDPVTLWGDGLPIEEVASATAGNAYCLVTCLPSRPSRVWA